jgi:hypothetical protein
MSAAALCAALVVGGLAAPAVADQTARSNDPSLSTFEQSAADELKAAVAKIRAEYQSTLTEARKVRDEALAAPRAERKRALRKADTKSERRTARREYRAAAAPTKAQYRATKSAARATRNAAIEEAVADYLVVTGDADLVEALKTYRAAVATAGETLALALSSSRSVFRTDTAEEREQLLQDLEEADSPEEVGQAWEDFVAACADERAAHAAAVAAARATYASALAKARGELEDATDMSIKVLLKLPFTI